MSRPRVKVMTRGMLLTLAGWVLLVAAAWHWSARWPDDADHWITFAVVIAAIEFLALKSWLMWRRAWVFDRLTGALIAANVMFALVYLWAFVLVRLWPSLQKQSWSADVWHALLIFLLGALIWGLGEMIALDDPPDDVTD